MRAGCDTAKNPSRASPFGLRKRFVTIAALLAIFLQAFVIQTHVEGAAASGSPHVQIAAQGSVSAIHASAQLDDWARHAHGCILCQTLAAAGTALLSTTPALGLERFDILAEGVVSFPRAPIISAHSWQSRAPPIAL